MKKQVILGLIVALSLLVLVSSAQATTTIHLPTPDEEISGTYIINVSTSDLCSWVGLNYSNDNITWSGVIGSNTSESTWFNISWDTSELCTGNYSLNATSNRTESDYVNVTINNNVITLVSPAAGETISSGNYTFNATTTATRAYVNFSYSNDSGVTWTEFGSNSTEGTEFTLVWDTSSVDDGTYYFNATTNCTILDERTETDENQGVIIDNVPATTVDSPEFTPIVMAALIGLLSATAILLRKKKE